MKTIVWMTWLAIILAFYLSIGKVLFDSAEHVRRTQETRLQEMEQISE